jgi:hypothetical protein
MLVAAEELLAGAGLTYDVELPAALFGPGEEGEPRRVRLRPLTVRDIQLIARAARDDEVLTSALMVQQALVEPQLKADQVANVPGGIVRFLVERINAISGLSTAQDELLAALESPLVQAFFALAREFSWTPDQVRELTVGQIIGYLELAQDARGRAA